MDKPDWVHCVGHTHVDLKGQSWCGQPLSGWHFVDAEHAAENGRKNGRLVACPDCVEKIRQALVNGHDEI